MHWLALPRGSDSRESTCNAGDLNLLPVLGRSPGGGHGNPLQYSCLEIPQGQRSLVGYSPCGRRESDRTEWAQHSTAQHSTGSLNLGDKGQCVTHNYNVISNFSQMPFIRNGDPLPLLACDILSWIGLNFVSCLFFISSVCQI